MKSQGGPRIEAQLRSFPTVVVLAIAAACLTAAGAALLNGSLIPAIAIAGALLVAIFAAAPPVAAISFLAATATVFDPARGIVSLGPLTLTSAELMLYPGLAAILVRRLAGYGPGSRVTFAGPILAYIAAAFGGLTIGILLGDAPDQAVQGFRAIFVLSGYWILREAFEFRPRTMGHFLVGIAVGGSVLAMVGAVLGWDVGGPSIDYVITGGEVSETVRLASPVLRLLTLVLPMAFMGAAFASRPARRWMLILTPMILAEAMSLTRSTWVPLVAACVALPALVARGSRPLLLIARTSSLVLAGLTVVLLATASALGPAQVTFDRLASTLDSSTARDDSLSDRTYEIGNAVTAITRHPVTGVGLQQSYGAFNNIYDPETNTTTQKPRRWIHNTPVGVWLWMGLLGVGSVLWLSTRIFRDGLAAYRISASAHRCMGYIPPSQSSAGIRGSNATIALGAAGGLAVLAVQSTFQTNLAYIPALATLAAGLAFLDVWASANSSTRSTTRLNDFDATSDIRGPQK